MPALPARKAWATLHRPEPAPEPSREYPALVCSDDASFALSLPYRPQQFGFLEQACQQLVLVTEHQNARCLRHDDNRILVVGM